MIQGLRTVIYPVTDLAVGKEWYSAVLERAPYFDEPFYVGFEVGGFELGLIPDGKPSADGVDARWGVPDIEAEVVRIQAIGGIIAEPISDVGGDIKVAAIADPFGNHFGLIQNPHFKIESVR